MRSFVAVVLLVQGICAFELLGLDFGNTFDKVFGLQRFRRDLGEGKPCSWTAFEQAFKCCTFPNFVPEGSIKKCVASTLKKKKKAGAKRIPGMSFACTADCALRKNNMILENGHCDLVMLQEKFLETADSTWKPVVQAAVKKCTEEQKQTNITEEGECKMGNLHLIYCLFREVTGNCPASSTPTDAKEAKECIAKVDKIEQCDPWSVMKDVEEKVASKVDSLKGKMPFDMPKDNPLSRIAERLKGLKDKAMPAVEDTKNSAKERLQNVKLGGQKLAQRAKIFFKDARDSFKN